MKTLCLYYSRTGLTRKAMETIAQITGADLAEYTDGIDRSGIRGYIGACIASMKKSFPIVRVPDDLDLSSYDRVIIGMPLWAEGPCIIGRAFIRQYRHRLPDNVYYVVTHMAKADYMRKIQTMDRLLGRPSSGQLSVQTKDHDYLKDVRSFAENL